jgi:hypothetical protein
MIMQAVKRSKAMIPHKSASVANLPVKVRRYQTFEVCETSKVCDRRGFGKTLAMKNLLIKISRTIK